MYFTILIILFIFKIWSGKNIVLLKTKNYNAEKFWLNKFENSRVGPEQDLLEVQNMGKKEQETGVWF